ncbi:hypothetical protein BCR44DRAFT_1454647, partial [Catenaria anguillulae PL171]
MRGLTSFCVPMSSRCAFSGSLRPSRKRGRLPAGIGMFILKCRGVCLAGREGMHLSSFGRTGPCWRRSGGWQRSCGRK